MDNTLPSQNSKLLKNLLGKKVVLVKRQLFKSDMDLADFEQNADGPVELTISDDSVLHFVADTEGFSIGVVPGEMPHYGDSYNLRNLSGNVFWGDRVDQEITQLTLFKSSDYSDDYPSEFGLEISFINGKKVLIEYKDEEDYPDMIRVVDHYSGRSCINELISSI